MRGRVAFFPTGKLILALVCAVCVIGVCRPAFATYANWFSYNSITDVYNHDVSTDQYKGGYTIIIGGRANCSLTRSAVNNAVSFSKTDYGSHFKIAVLDVDNNPSLFRSTFASKTTDRVRFYTYRGFYNSLMWTWYRNCGGTSNSISLPFVFVMKDNNISRYATGNTGISSIAKAGTSLTQPPSKNLTGGPYNLYRMYNESSGEHLYTSNTKETKNLWGKGWFYEGVSGIVAPESSNPVYRVYNPNSGEHHYTRDANERNVLTRIGWRDEGIAFYSGGLASWDRTEEPVYRLFNPNNRTGPGSHHYTMSTNEKNYLLRIGWRDEGVGWYASK